MCIMLGLRIVAMGWCSDEDVWGAVLIDLLTRDYRVNWLIVPSVEDL